MHRAGRSGLNRQRTGLPQQIAGALRAQILGGGTRPGDQLETEPTLARRLGVSRSTLRSAIALLEHEGHVERRHGAGTFVTARPVLRNDLGQNFSVTDMISRFVEEDGVTFYRQDFNTTSPHSSTPIICFPLHRPC